MTTRDTWRGLGGFSHLAQYTAVRTGPGPSNWRDVMNRFARFKFFAEQVCDKEVDGQLNARTLDEAERGERCDRCTAQGDTHDHTRQHIAQKVHAQHDAGYRNA